MKYLRVLVSGCDQKKLPAGQMCATEAEQDAFVNSTVFSLWIKTNFVVFDDIEKPLHQHLFQALRHTINPDFLFAKSIKLQVN